MNVIFLRDIYDECKYFCDKNNNFFSKIFFVNWNLFFVINREITSLFNFLIAFHNNYFTITILYMKN